MSRTFSLAPGGRGTWRIWLANVYSAITLIALVGVVCFAMINSEPPIALSQRPAVVKKNVVSVSNSDDQICDLAELEVQHAVSGTNAPFATTSSDVDSFFDPFASEPSTTKDPKVVFRQYLPRILQADQERMQACCDLGKNVETALLVIHQQSISDEMVSSVTSLSSKASYLADSTNHRFWIAKEFANHVISSDDLTSIVKSELAVFQAKLIDIDNRLLVDLRADIDCDPSSVQLKPIDFGPLQTSIGDFQSTVTSAISASLQEDLASFFVALAAEEVGRQGALAWYADENGEVTPFQEFSAMIVGSLTGLLADQVVSNIANVDEKVVDKCRQARESILAQTMPTYDDGKLWFADALQHAREHRDIVLAGIITELNLDVDWAASEYAQAFANLEVK